MRALIIYESMFGNTRKIADAIERGLSHHADVTVRAINAVPESALDDIDLVVVGAPTHAHSLPSPDSRAEAGIWAKNPDKNLTLEPDFGGIGIREWIKAQHSHGSTLFAAFTTRADMPSIFSGDASRRIDHRMRKLGLEAVTEPRAFLVNFDNRLVEGQAEEAVAWGDAVGTAARTHARLRHSGSEMKNSS